MPMGGEGPEWRVMEPGNVENDPPIYSEYLGDRVDLWFVTLLRRQLDDHEMKAPL